MFNIHTYTSPTYPDQRAGTSGLRKQVAVFRQPGYLQNFIQAILLTLDEDPKRSWRNQTIVLGGDGRYFNDEAIGQILAMTAAHGVGRVLIGRDGILSTPAASHLVRRHDARGALILSASHNPGGPEGDFGIKLNLAGGAPAPEAITEAIHARSCQLEEYTIADAPPVDISRPGRQRLGDMLVEVIDPVEDYARLMESLFDFDAIAGLLRGGRFRLLYDAMHAATGPYARAILGERLGLGSDSLIRTRMLPDFGGEAPDPCLQHAHELVLALFSEDPPDMGAASDGDGDRNLILAPGLMVPPGDSLAVLAANASLAPGYAGGIRGIARSMPTSRAADRVAEALGIPLFETPTGWKFFCNLLDDGRIDLCGEESFGTSSAHVREKDGLWAVLFWLNILAIRRESVTGILHDHWRRYGRDFYLRHDYEGLDLDSADALIADLHARLPRLPGQEIQGVRIERADEFIYTDPVTSEVASGHGMRVFLADGSRLVFRLSGTGTTGATLRIYGERHEPDASRHGLPPATMLAELMQRARAIARIPEHTGRDQPSAAVG